MAAASMQVQLPQADASVDLSHLNAHIAHELALGLSDAVSIRNRYGITNAQWDHLKRNPTFRSMLAEAIREFQGDQNARQRIKLKADIILEDAIPAYDKMIHNEACPASERINAGKLLAQLAGHNAKEGVVAAAGGGFTLNINLDGGRGGVVIEGHPIPVEEDV